MTNPTPSAAFVCKECTVRFSAEWDFAPSVVCPVCGTEFETFWDYTDSGDVQGPWLGSPIMRLGT